MTDIVDFLHCSFCGRSTSDIPEAPSQKIEFIIRSNLGKGACVCDKCIMRMHILVCNCYNDLFEDNNYNLD